MQIAELEKRIHNGTFVRNSNPFTLRILQMMPLYVKEQCEVITMDAKEVVYYKGEEPKYSYFILSGEITVVSEFESGRIYEPIVLKDSEFTGIVEAILDQKEILSTNITGTKVELIKVPNRLIHGWMDESPEFVKLLLFAISEYFHTNMEWSGQNVILGSKYLFVNYLLNHAQKDNDIYVLNETREKTAKRTGINLRTLYRYINEFKDLGIIKSHGRKIFFSENEHKKLVDIYMQLRNTL